MITLTILFFALYFIALVYFGIRIHRKDKKLRKEYKDFLRHNDIDFDN
jgi:preprotein translocase subunit YajC